jgi:hypothetical protein
VGQVAQNAKVTKLDTVAWGPNITDIRNFSKHDFIPTRGDTAKLMGRGCSQSEAEARLKATIDAAPPGVIFSSNPHYGIYAKWDNLLMKNGFRLVSKLCAINRVYSRNWTWKGGQFGGRAVDLKTSPWESPDGWMHWTHAMYLVKEPVPTLTFDFAKFDGANGDTDGHKMWNVGYGTRATVPYKSGSSYEHPFESKYARLAHNCGCAMGSGLPENGKFVDEEFYTIAAIPADELFPTGYTRFLTAGGLKFGHNLKKLLGDTAQECPHKFDVLG